MKRALLLGVTCIGVAVTAAAWGDSPTITAQVPHDRNVSLAQATRTIVNPPGGSPAPTAPLVTAAHRLPPSPAGFACDVQGCEFTRMPLYNQTNPNLAFVDVPASVYAAEARKVTGQLVPDPAARHDAIVVSTPGVANATELDPYYESWLPLGSMVGDQGSLGYWLSATCGPTAESMALMAAMAAMRPTTQIVPGSWTDRSFVNAQAPAGQGALPSPLNTDHSSLAPTPMTAQDLQRVINMAVLQGTDPTSGGGAAAFLQQAQSDFRFAGPPSPPGTLPHLVVQTANNDLPISSARLVSYLRQRWVVVVAIHKYVANVWGPTMGSRVKQVSFTLQAGHLVALAGFHGDETQASFIIHDPVYANVLDLPFTTLGGGGVRDSGLLLVSLPNGKTTELMVQYDTPAGTPVPVDASTLTNGQIVWFVHEYSALRLD